MATDTDSVQNHMTRLRMKMVQQKIANERDKLNRPSSTDSGNDLDEQVKLQQAMLRRQELLDKIRHEQLVNEDYGRRPRSHSARRRYTPSPLPPPPSRRSLPDFNRNQSFRDDNNNPYRDKDMQQVKHIIEHRVKTPPQYHLPPIQNPPQLPVVANPQPYPQHIIQQVPQPVVQNLVPEQRQSMFNKGDWMEMMMMQNHQMHQLVVQQMMLRSLPGGSLSQAPVTYLSEPAVVRSPPPAVHHHHYQMSPPPQPAVHHYSALPPLEPRIVSPVRVDAPRAIEPRVIAVPERQPTLVSPQPGARRSVKKKSIPFPGPKGLRKFRHVAYAAWFISALKALREKNAGSRPSSVFLFGIILKEIVAALHRIYLNPSGNIYPVLADAINPKAYDLSNLVRGRTGEREGQTMIQELQYIVENLIYHITEIMPSTGVLGTHRKSAVYELIKNGKRFPDGYFWQVELDRIQFTENGRTTNIGDPEAFMLIIGIFISRSLITTLLMKPVDYGLSNQQLSDVAERNLKVIATTMLYLVRRVSVSRGRAMMSMPGEIAKYLYSDEEMRPIYSRIAKSFNYAEGLLREWGQEYIKRLRNAPTLKN
ncbi:uncharacterized protein LOC133183052 isoform X2 [Saccostrea echinata]|uniref:uncharacterized protein LOC133183052 isoform X2 n=1 Tax=Saccostrea echinata TaxID=191078 RepID=UPI002A83A709|nr:uncharacterized protein LOC133183052 isoform X2 [Saccostrea echinata]